METALVIGATGLVGNELVHQLLESPSFSKVIIFVRRHPAIEHPKLEVHIIDFDAPESWRELVKGDVLFSALGTTIEQAGSKEAQYKIDHTYQYNFAKAASENNVPTYVLVSAANSDPSSRIFYSRMKGELERDVKKLSFKSIHILQPGLLAGKRKEERVGEKLGFVVLNAVNKLGLFKKYKPIEGSMVAKAMINTGLSTEGGVHVHTLDEVFSVANYGAS